MRSGGATRQRARIALVVALAEHPAGPGVARDLYRRGDAEERLAAPRRPGVIKSLAALAPTDGSAWHDTGVEIVTDALARTIRASSAPRWASSPGATSTTRPGGRAS